MIRYKRVITEANIVITVGTMKHFHIKTPYIELLVLISIIQLTYGLQEEQSCSSNTLEECTKNLLRYSSEDVKVPETVEEVKENCVTIRNGSKCIKKYFNKCSPSVVKQMTRIAMSGVTRTINKHCSDQGIEDLLQHRQCISDVRLEIKSCYDGLVYDFYQIRMSNNRKDWHPMTCCFISKFHECNVKAVNDKCEETSRAYYSEEANKLMDELMELICPSNYRWGEDDCTQLVQNMKNVEPPEGEKPMLLPLIIDMMKKYTD